MIERRQLNPQMSSHDDIRIRQITLARPGLYTAAGSLLSIQISSTISPEEIPAQEDSESPEERQTAETEAEAEADQSSGDVQNDDQNDLGVYMCRLHSKGPITEHHTTLFRYGGGGRALYRTRTARITTTAPRILQGRHRPERPT